MPMQFKFDPNQDFQLRAIESVADLFEGQPRVHPEVTFALRAGFAAVPNCLDLDDTSLLANLNAVQSENGIPTDNALESIENRIETADGPKTVAFPNFSVEMETGTGKTYVYTRTALELFRRYGLRKFIIVVPSVAIREGVLKSLQVTETHLLQHYENMPYRYYVYDSKNLSQVRQFALSNSVELMVMTIDSFNKAQNVIHQSTDHLQGETPIHLVQATRPILILDEPQNMESELRIKALSALDPLLALRYSATHRNPYNLVYRLTPFEAYRHGLVKRIEVASVVKEDDFNQVFLRLDQIMTHKNTVTARIAVHKLMRDGTVKEKTVKVKRGDSLEEKSCRPEYAGFDVDEINPGGGYVRFANDVELRKGESRGADKEALFDAQIRYTIEEHMRKQERFMAAGVKVLSLFFIDRVDNYALEDGIIRRLFLSAYLDIRKKHPAWEDKDPREVQAAYFAEKRRKAGNIEVLDSVTGKTKADEAAYNLIMKDKERLLSFDEPVAFIFSHSALREGWDNPNVFQICTLNQTASEVKKRQEVGRGVRLCVDQSGDRLRDERINVLTVVANESYERYVARLQSELQEDFGGDIPPRPPDARRRGKATLRKHYTLKPEFKELWERIKHKTRYAVKIDTQRLLADVVPQIDGADISPPCVTITKAEVLMDSEDSLKARHIAKTAKTLSRRGPLRNLVQIMENLMENTSPAMRLTRATLLEVFKRAQDRSRATDNPQGFATAAVRIIKDRLADHLVSGIQYERINDCYEMTQLEAEIDSWLEYLVPADASVYDHVICDSELEKQFVEGLSNRRDVKMFVKLPPWFTVPTPVGEYNPDWAIVMEELDEHGDPVGKPLLYLVRETKDRNWRTELRPDERRKIYCGERHFRGALGVDYKVVTDARELP